MIILTKFTFIVSFYVRICIDQLLKHAEIARFHVQRLIRVKIFALYVCSMWFGVSFTDKSVAHIHVDEYIFTVKPPPTKKKTIIF